MAVLHSTYYRDGFVLEQLENERGQLYYRACHNSICRYCEDDYQARMYLAAMGWDANKHAELSSVQLHPPDAAPKKPDP